jgi:pilus assembly protein CpaB
MMLVIIAAAGLLGVFLLIADYVSTVSKQVGAKISVVELISPLNAYQPVTADMLGEVSLPRKWAPPNAVTDPSTVLDMVSPIPLRANTELEQGMLEVPPGLTSPHREMPLVVNAESGVAYQLRPGDFVDVIASYQGNSQNGGQAAHNRVVTLVSSVPVLTIEQPSGGSSAGSVAVLLSVTPREAQEIVGAESFATKLILTKVAPGAPPETPPPYLIK